jgi:hypothetical protein
MAVTGNVHRKGRWRSLCLGWGLLVQEELQVTTLTFCKEIIFYEFLVCFSRDGVALTARGDRISQAQPEKETL